MEPEAALVEEPIQEELAEVIEEPAVVEENNTEQVEEIIEEPIDEADIEEAAMQDPEVIAELIEMDEDEIAILRQAEEEIIEE